MSDTKQNIVPFGKYKGQPIEALAQDRTYLDWLSAQNWFRERYAGIYTLIINNFSEATETPDHNALQVLFLDDAFCERFIAVLKPQWGDGIKKELSDHVLRQRQQLVDHAESKWISDERKKEAETALRKYDEVKLKWGLSFRRQFEQHGVDVNLQCTIGTTEKLPRLLSSKLVADDFLSSWFGSFNIEIKPTVGDDYPAVLRQMRANRSDLLFTENYTGVGATKEQFVKTFALSGIKVIFRRDVDAIQLEQATDDRLLDVS